MQILLIAATEQEIAPFLALNASFDHLITGVGVPVSLYHITKRLQQIDYDLVIQAGIAGSFTSSLQLGDVVLVSRDNFADVGIKEQNNFSTIFEKGFADGNLFPFTNGWLENNTELISRSTLEKVSAVTINTVTDDPIQISRLVEKFQPQIETMEGAALHFICLQEKIPFLQIRSISNYVGERNKTKWKMKEAIDNLNSALIKIVDELTV